MAAMDVEPSRLAAAQTAAKALLRARPPGVRLGIIAVSMHADLVQTPTSSHEDAIAAIEQLDVQEGIGIGIGIGSGIVGALVTICGSIAWRKCRGLDVPPESNNALRSPVVMQQREPFLHAMCRRRT